MYSTPDSAKLAGLKLLAVGSLGLMLGEHALEKRGGAEREHRDDDQREYKRAAGSLFAL